MSYTIRWENPLTATERRWLRYWLDRLDAKRPGVVERRRGGLVVRHSTHEFAHSFAALTMAILDRPIYGYTLEPANEAAPALAAA